MDNETLALTLFLAIGAVVLYIINNCQTIRCAVNPQLDTMLLLAGTTVFLLLWVKK